MNGHPQEFYYDMETGTLEIKDNIYIDKEMCTIGEKS